MRNPQRKGELRDGSRIEDGEVYAARCPCGLASPDGCHCGNAVLIAARQVVDAFNEFEDRPGASDFTAIRIVGPKVDRLRIALDRAGRGRSGKEK